MESQKQPLSIRLVAADIDGTLTDADGRLGECAHRAKELCESRGAIFTLATGRVSSSAESVAREMGIRAPFICNGGAAIKEPGGRYLVEHTLKPQAVSQSLEIARRYGFERYAYASERYITETPGEHVRPYSEVIGIPITIVPDLFEHIDEGMLSLVFRTDRGREDLEASVGDLMAELSDISRSNFRVNRSLPHLLEISRPQACKAQALTTLCELLGVSLSETLAVGDDFGDVDMIDIAGVGVLVANAAEHLKTAGRLVSRGAHSEGVYESVLKYVARQASE